MTDTKQTPIDEALAAKAQQLEAILRSLGSVLVGYSGGVDSTLLAVAAQRALGDRAVAVTAVSPSLASGDLDQAAALCRQFGIRHEVLHTHEIDNPEYSRNPPNRCYFCKSELLSAMAELANRLQVPHVVYGQNVDDGQDYRPGAQAARERGVRAPLAEVGMNKADIRALARAWGIPVWDRPAAACLSSRFPYGTPITAAALAQVDRAERYLRETCGYRQLRCRHHGPLARVELLAEDLSTLLGDPDRRAALGRELRTIGYAHASVDLRGFRSGSMNEALLAVEPPAGAPPQRLGDALSGVAGGPYHWTAHEHMVHLRTSAAGIAALADPVARQLLVSRLEGLGCRYAALDLEAEDV